MLLESTYVEEIAIKFIIHISLKEIWMALRILNLCFTHCKYHDSNNTAAALKKPTILQKVQKNQTVTNVTYLFLLLLDEEPTTNFAVFNLQLLLNVLGSFHHLPSFSWNFLAINIS